MNAPSRPSRTRTAVVAALVVLAVGGGVGATTSTAAAGVPAGAGAPTSSRSGVAPAGSLAAAGAERDGLAPSDVALAPGQRARVLVTVAPARDPAAFARVEAAVAAPGAAGRGASGAHPATYRSTTIPVVAAEVDSGALASLRAQAGVVAVYEDRELRTADLTRTTAEIGAPGAWAGGATGAGQTIVVVDTGVDATHPMLAGKVVAEACFTVERSGAAPGAGSCPDGTTTQVGPGAAVPCASLAAGCGHGTHVASIAAGDGGGVRGVAPGAQVVAVQVFGPVDTGYATSESAVVRAFDHVASLRTTYSIAAVNLSLGGATTTTPCDRDPGPLVQAAAALESMGIAVVAAAGNVGNTASVAYPACSAHVVSVASVGSTNAYSGFSNRSAVQQLAAPGELVTAAAPGGGTQTISGTSQATPHVAGAFALVRAQQPALPVAAVVDLLRRTGDPVFDPVLRQPTGAARVRVDRATDPAYRTDTPAVLARPGSPLGVLDVVAPAVGGVRVAAWTVDPDTAAPGVLHVYVDGRFTSSLPADGRRDDIARAFPGFGPWHGADAVVAVAPGAHDVCVHALDQGPARGPVLLGCRSVLVGGLLGALDAVTPMPGAVEVAGWAATTRSTAPVVVHVYVDGAVADGFHATRPRPDVAGTYPTIGAGHGFARTVAAGAGPHDVCVFAIDPDGGPNPSIGCRRVVVPGGAPVGALDVASRDGRGSARVAGWALDPDTVGPIAVHAYVDGVLAGGVLAGAPRSDVGAVLPAYGPAHGFDLTVAVGPGPHVVCVFAIDASGTGPNPALGCRDIA